MLMTDRALLQPVRCEITVEPGYLRADLYNRLTADDTRIALSEIAGTCIKRHLYRVLVRVHASKPVFTVEKYGFSCFVELVRRYSGKVALLADSVECRIAQDYAAMLAHLRGADIRSFRKEAAAIQWLIEEADWRAGAGGRRRASRRNSAGTRAT
jgi:hypothetical protein